MNFKCFILRQVRLVSTAKDFIPENRSKSYLNQWLGNDINGENYLMQVERQSLFRGDSKIPDDIKTKNNVTIKRKCINIQIGQLSVPIIKIDWTSSIQKIESELEKIGNLHGNNTKLHPCLLDIATIKFTRYSKEECTSIVEKIKVFRRSLYILISPMLIPQISTPIASLQKIGFCPIAAVNFNHTTLMKSSAPPSPPHEVVELDESDGPENEPSMNTLLGLPMLESRHILPTNLVEDNSFADNLNNIITDKEQTMPRNDVTPGSTSAAPFAMTYRGAVSVFVGADGLHLYASRISLSPINFLSSFSFCCVLSQVRSGQQVYAAGKSLIVLGAVHSGGEVLADGDVHVYGRLSGRAVAGLSSGDRGGARWIEGGEEAEVSVYCSSFDASLIGVGDCFIAVDEHPALQSLRGTVGCRFT